LRFLLPLETSTVWDLIPRLSLAVYRHSFTRTLTDNHKSRLEKISISTR
jgi:hypothetical protein